MSDEYADEDAQAPTYREVLWEMKWYLYLPLALFFGIGAVANVALLVHMHVLEIGFFAQFELVEDKWVYYANTAVYTGMFVTLVWLISNDAPDTMEILR